MHAAVKELEGKERNVVGLHREEVVCPDEAAVEEHLAVVDSSLGWWLVDIRRLFVDEVDPCWVLDVARVHEERIPRGICSVDTETTICVCERVRSRQECFPIAFDVNVEAPLEGELIVITTKKPNIIPSCTYWHAGDTRRDLR